MRDENMGKKLLPPLLQCISFCDKLGFNYVSCSPYRVPIARLAAAKAAILRKQGK